MAGAAFIAIVSAAWLLLFVVAPLVRAETERGSAVIELDESGAVEAIRGSVRVEARHREPWSSRKGERWIAAAGGWAREVAP